MNKRQLSFEGNHKEVGEKVGELYKQWGKKELYIPPFINEYYPKQLELYQKYFPAYLEFLEGVSQGLGIAKDLVLQSYLAGYLQVASKKKENNKCSTFALKNSHGVFIGRNYDWLEASEKYSMLLSFNYTDNSAKSITGISDMGTWKFAQPAKPDEFVLIMDEAWNSKGLYINLSGAPGEKRTYGICTPHVVQLITEQCETTEEAVALVSEIPIPDPKVFTIADKNGNFAVVEKQIGKEAKVTTSKRYIVTTNHYQHPDLLLDNEEIFKTLPFHSTFARYHYLKLMLQKSFDTITLKDILPILDKAPVVQNWRGRANGDVLTIWECALNLANHTYQVKFAPLLNSNTTVNNF